MISEQRARAETGLDLRWWRLPNGHQVTSGKGERLTPYRLSAGGKAVIHWSAGESGSFQAGSWRIPTGPPTLIVMPANIDYEVRKEPSAMTDWWVIGSDSPLGTDPSTIPIGHPAFRAFRRLRTLFEQGAEAMECEEEMDALLLGASPPSYPATPCARAASHARDLIHALHREPLTLDGLAREAGLSRAHLVRSFRQSYATTPGAYLRSVRLAAARQHLSDGLSVSDAARRSGFASVPSFCHSFRKAYGLTPSEVKNEPQR